MDTRDFNVENCSRQAVDALTPAQKFARMQAFLHQVRDLYAHQLRGELGEITDEHLKQEARRQLYSGDRRAGADRAEAPRHSVLTLSFRFCNPSHAC